MSLRDSITATVVAELATACEKFAPMNSAHEGWAVILEEVDELGEEFEQINGLTRGMFQSVRKNDPGAARAEAELIALVAERAAVEAVQVAAMAKRFLTDVPASDQPTEGGARDA
ncbi:hypothetical protein DMP17_22065 [Pseudonocardia sp. TMWB2A]|uniref:hypothetical protein n=1 Tax=Pseudonocardia sp. TMWB2A TaxID=687430 RepID=UPI00307E45BB